MKFGFQGHGPLEAAPLFVVFSNACKRRICGDSTEVLVERTWISRSSALLLFFRMRVREEFAQAQVKSWSEDP